MFVVERLVSTWNESLNSSMNGSVILVAVVVATFNIEFPENSRLKVRFFHSVSSKAIDLQVNETREAWTRSLRDKECRICSMISTGSRGIVFGCKGMQSFVRMDGNVVYLM